MRVKRILSRTIGQAVGAFSSEQKDCSSNLGSTIPDILLSTLVRDGFVIHWYRRKVMLDTYTLIQKHKLFAM